jgi:hypothetical protein
MGSRNGGRPVILSARRGFEPTRWQDQTLATAYRLVFAQSQLEPRTGRPVDRRIGLSSVGTKAMDRRCRWGCRGTRSDRAMINDRTCAGTRHPVLCAPRVRRPD